eukprot:3822556-Rhodomonas_salina.1
MRESGLGPLAGTALAAMFLQGPVFNGLDLSGNAIKDQGARAIAEMLCKNASLMSLDMRSNDIGMDGGIALFEALLQNKAITEVCRRKQSRCVIRWLTQHWHSSIWGSWQETRVIGSELKWRKS